MKFEAGGYVYDTFPRFCHETNGTPTGWKNLDRRNHAARQVGNSGPWRKKIEDLTEEELEEFSRVLEPYMEEVMTQ